MFCCNCQAIANAIVNSFDLLNCLFSILDWEAPIDTRAAGFFSKIVSVLLLHNPERMLQISMALGSANSASGLDKEGKENHHLGWLLPKLLRHMESYSITLCIKHYLKVASEECFGSYQLTEADKPEARTNPVLQHAHSIWLGSSGAALAILDALSLIETGDAHRNASEVLAEMVHRAALARLSMQANLESNEGSVGLPTFSGMILVSSGQGENSRIALIESGVEWTVEFCRKLLDYALQGDEKLSTASLQVLNQLVHAFALERWAKPGSLFVENGTFANPSSVESQGQIPAELELIVDKLDDLCALLIVPEDGAKTQTQYGEKVNKLGFRRLEAVQLICMLIHSKYPKAIESVALSKSKPLGKCLDLFFEFEWANLLHLAGKLVVFFQLLA